MRNCTSVVILVLFSAIAMGVAQAEGPTFTPDELQRIYHNQQGQAITAKLLALSGDETKIYIEMDDGRKLVVALSIFSQNDVAYVLQAAETARESLPVEEPSEETPVEAPGNRAGSLTPEDESQVLEAALEEIRELCGLGAGGLSISINLSRSEMKTLLGPVNTSSSWFLMAPNPETGKLEHVASPLSSEEMSEWGKLEWESPHLDTSIGLISWVAFSDYSSEDAPVLSQILNDLGIDRGRCEFHFGLRCQHVVLIPSGIEVEVKADELTLNPDWNPEVNTNILAVLEEE